jgi:hypothetical protein
MKRNLGRSRKAERDRRSRRNLFFAVSGGIFFVLTAFLLFFNSQSIHPPLDELTLCPTTRAPAQEHLVILDATDPWNDLQRRVILDEISLLQGRLPRFARVHLYTIVPGAPLMPEAALMLCNPGLPGQIEELPILRGWTAAAVANPALMVDRWNTGFISRMDSVLTRYAESPTAPQSPIMEILRGASVQAFGRADSDAAPKYVHIFSDMLQHSGAYSHYSPPAWSAEVARALADPGRNGTRSLEGATVSIFLIDRPEVGRRPGQSRGALVAFWESFLAAQGAILTRVERIEG